MVFKCCCFLTVPDFADISSAVVGTNQENWKHFCFPHVSQISAMIGNFSPHISKICDGQEQQNLRSSGIFSTYENLVLGLLGLLAFIRFSFLLYLHDELIISVFYKQ